MLYWAAPKYAYVLAFVSVAAALDGELISGELDECPGSGKLCNVDPETICMQVLEEVPEEAGQAGKPILFEYINRMNEQYYEIDFWTMAGVADRRSSDVKHLGHGGFMCLSQWSFYSTIRHLECKNVNIRCSASSWKFAMNEFRIAREDVPYDDPDFREWLKYAWKCLELTCDAEAAKHYYVHNIGLTQALDRIQEKDEEYLIHKLAERDPRDITHYGHHFALPGQSISVLGQAALPRSHGSKRGSNPWLPRQTAQWPIRRFVGISNAFTQIYSGTMSVRLISIPAALITGLFVGSAITCGTLRLRPLLAQG